MTNQLAGLQGEEDDLPTPLDTKPVRHRLAQTQPLPVPMREVQQIHWDNIEGEASMTKEDALKMIKLLSAMESWSFSVKDDLPVYLHEDLCLAVEKLEKIVLTEKP
jgi:hypothetical protein